MSSQSVQSSQYVTETWLADLVETHCQLSSYRYSKGPGPVYVLNSSEYISPKPTDVTQQALTRYIFQCGQPAFISLFHTVIQDRQMLDDYYNIALRDAQEEVLWAIDSVLQSRNCMPWLIQPAFVGGILWLDQDGALGSYIESELNILSDRINSRDFNGSAITYERLERISRLVSAANQAFSVAKASLNRFDMNSHLEVLIQNEVFSELA